LPDGTPVINLAVAFNYGRKAQGGERHSQWLDLALFGKQAESLVPYLLKGTQVSVTARDPHIEMFTRGNGETGSKLAATIIDIELVGRRNESGQAPQQNYQPSGAQGQPSAKQAPSHDNLYAPYDDDVSF
jgi:single-strand DNA-binding protein